MAEDFRDKSYRIHSEHYAEHADGGEKNDQARSWLDGDTVDAWRHARLIGIIDPVIKARTGASWLTVGDGRYGLEAQYINSRGGKATATDISDSLLEEAAADGLLDSFSCENAEALSFPDNSFDLVFCKQSYHHFPRPPVALYEMLRVAREAVVLVEPADPTIGLTFEQRLFRRAVDGIRLLLGREVPRYQFEEAGNYVYGISRPEITKAALALRLPAVAFKGINDYYQEPEEGEDDGPGSALFATVKRRIAMGDLLTGLGLRAASNLCGVVLVTPSADLIKVLRKNGFAVEELPGEVEGDGKREKVKE
jgi:SAM-dependent methyltransferase